VQRHLLSFSLGHQAAPLAVRERASLDGEQAERLLRRLSDDAEIDGALVLSTCGRVEVYVTGVHPKRMRKTVLSHFGELGDLFQERSALASARHLFRVATGLESPLIGESQILGQLRAAGRQARSLGALDGMLGGTFDRAVAAARRARRESGLGRGAASIGHAAVALLRTNAGTVRGTSVLVVGAGEVGTLAARALVAAGAELRIASRSPSSAAAVAQRTAAETLALDEVPAALAEVDAAVFCAAAAQPLLTPDAVAEAAARRRGRPLLVLDLAVPRNVAPTCAEIAGVRLVNVDDVAASVSSGVSRRRSAAAEAERVLEAELRDWSEWQRTAGAGPTLAALAAYADGIREREVLRTLKALGDADPEVRRRVEALSRSLVSRLMLHPISYVRAHPDDRAAGELLQRLFSEPPGRP